MLLFRWWRNEPGCYVDRQCMIADCEFSFKVYSDDWRDKVSSWKEEARVAFVSELLHQRNVPEIAAFARPDPSNKVKEVAAQGLSWIGAEEDAAQFLASLDADTFDHIVANLHTELIPASILDRAIGVLQKHYAEATDPLLRLKILLKTAELGVTRITDQLKEDLGRVTGKLDDHHAHFVIKPA